MKKIYIQLYACFVIAVMLITVCVFVFKILEDAEKGKTNANITFGKFTKILIAEINNSEFASEEYKAAVIKYAKQLDVKAFSIILPESKISVSYSAEKEAEENYHLQKSSSKFIKTFSGSIQLNVNGKIEKASIAAMINILSSEIIFVRIRTVFIIALTIFLITVILLIFLNLQSSDIKIYADINNKRTAKYKDDFPVNTEGYEKNKSETQKRIHENFNAPNRSAVTESNEFNSLDDLNNLNIYKNGYSEFKEAAHTETMQNENEFSGFGIQQTEKYRSVNSEIQTDEKTVVSTNTMPEGLYSPLTGLGWQEYLAERLEAEIGRAASSDQDISFIIIKLKNVNLKQIKVLRVSELLTDTFKFRDMVFEYGENGFAGILQDASLEDAMRISNNIFSGLQAELEFQTQNPSIAIGITSRSYRLISAARMIEEAEAAAVKAAENTEDPIVAFRANPDKYRNFVAKTEKEGLNYPSM